MDRYGTNDRREGRDFRNKFPNQGSLNNREKKSQSSPDMGGSFTISEDVLEYVKDEIRNGATEVKLELAAWRKLGNNNQAFLSLSVKVPWAIRQDQGDTDRRYSRQSDDRGRQDTARGDDRRGGYQRSDPRDYDRGEPSRPEQERGGASRYAEQSGRYSPRDQKQEDERRANEEFRRGDRMPDFGTRNTQDDDDPLKPPF